MRSFYLDLRRYRKSLAESDTPFTPGNTLIKAQRVSLKRIRAEGIENLWARHTRIASACRAIAHPSSTGGRRADCITLPRVGMRIPMRIATPSRDGGR